ncbi:hypothetical protein BpHYR1_013523, partial [Brachionus plicatilis]
LLLESLHISLLLLCQSSDYIYYSSNKLDITIREFFFNKTLLFGERPPGLFRTACAQFFIDY